MFSQEPPKELARVVDTRVRTETITAQCLDDDAIAALAEGTADPDQRRAQLSHVASCARCRTAVASVARAFVDPAVAREAAAIDAGGWRRFSRFAVPAAAAAALVLLLAWPRQVDDRPGHRGGGTQLTAPVPTAPIGTVADAAVLRWSPLPGSTRYRVTLYSAEGRVLYETQVVDTLAALPDSVAVVPGRLYLWKIEAQVGFDRWTASDLTAFTVGRPPAR